MKKVDRKEKDNTAFMDDLQEKGGLLKLILSGFALRINASLDKETVRIIGNELKLTEDFLAKYISMALKGLYVKIRLSDEDTYGVAVKRLRESNISMPDAADLVDSLGMLVAEETPALDFYDNMPFVKNFIDALRSLAQTDLELGYFNSKILVSANFKSDGIADLFDLIMEGLEE